MGIGNVLGGVAQGAIDTTTSLAANARANQAAADAHDQAMFIQAREHMAEMDAQAARTANLNADTAQTVAAAAAPVATDTRAQPLTQPTPDAAPPQASAIPSATAPKLVDLTPAPDVNPYWNTSGAPAAAPQPSTGSTSFSLSPKDRDAGIRMLAGETRGEPAIGQVAAAHVALNRLASGYGGAKSLADVIEAPKQFTAMGTDYVKNLSPKDPVYRRMGAVLDSVASGSTPDPTNGALNYINPKLQATNGAPMPGGYHPDSSIHIGNHDFYTPGKNVAGAQPQLKHPSTTPDVDQSAPSTIRNNNWGGVMSRSDGSMWPGQTGSDNNGRAIFATPADGAQAADVNLQNFAGKSGTTTTINDLMTKSGFWPGTHVDAEKVAGYAGMSPTDPIDLNDPKTRNLVSHAVMTMVNGPASYHKALAGMTEAPAAGPSPAGDAAYGPTAAETASRVASGYGDNQPAPKWAGSIPAVYDRPGGQGVGVTYNPRYQDSGWVNPDAPVPLTQEQRLRHAAAVTQQMMGGPAESGSQALGDIENERANTLKFREAGRNDETAKITQIARLATDPSQITDALNHSSLGNHIHLSAVPNADKSITVYTHSNDDPGAPVTAYTYKNLDEMKEAIPDGPAALQKLQDAHKTVQSEIEARRALGAYHGALASSEEARIASGLPQAQSAEAYGAAANSRAEASGKNVANAGSAYMQSLAQQQANMEAAGNTAGAQATQKIRDTYVQGITPVSSKMTAPDGVTQREVRSYPGNYQEVQLPNGDWVAIDQAAAAQQAMAQAAKSKIDLRHGRVPGPGGTIVPFWNIDGDTRTNSGSPTETLQLYESLGAGSKSAIPTPGARPSASAAPADQSWYTDTPAGRAAQARAAAARKAADGRRALMNSAIPTPTLGGF